MAEQSGLERDDVNGSVFVPVYLSHPVNEPVVVAFHTVDGTATAGEDYARWGTPTAPRTITIPPGSVQGTINVPVLADDVVESDETFSVVLTSVAGADAVIGNGSASATIVDSDGLAGPNPVIAVSSPTVYEGDEGPRRAQFQVHLSRAPASNVTISYATADRTAVAGEDYVAKLPGMVVFAPGQISKTIDVLVHADDVANGDRDFALEVSVIGGSPVEEIEMVGTATIIDDDASGPAPSRPSLSAGTGHTCTVADGSVRCWGDNTHGQLGDGTTASSGTPVPVVGIDDAVVVAVGDEHTCALSVSGAVQCWGHNGSGRLGDGTTASSSVPVPVVGLDDATSIVAGGRHTCARSSEGLASCWGSNAGGQIGTGTTTNAFTTPVPVTDLGVVAELAAGGFHTCARLEVGGMRCWGLHGSGQLGTNTLSTMSRVPVDVVGLVEVDRITAGAAHTCAVLPDRSARCWGYNGFGQLGTNTGGTNANLPGVVVGVEAAIDIVAGVNHTCVVSEGGGVSCWGANGDGQLGAGYSSPTVQVAAPAVGLPDTTALALGSTHTCAVSVEGVHRCVGRNEHGQLGAGYLTYATQPVQVAAVVADGAMSTFDGHSCVVVAGSVACWGANPNGQLGNGTTSSGATLPVEVDGLIDVTEVVVGGAHSCARTDAGTVECWGANSDGQLGDGTTTQSMEPVAVVGLSDVVALAAGGRHTCAVTLDGTVRCWGRNTTGQLGSGNSTSSAIPVAVSSLDNAVDVVAGSDHSCALLDGGSVRCWGARGQGRLGDDTSTFGFSSIPVSVHQLTTAVQLSGGGAHTCAGLASGGVQCWGSNTQGQLGNGLLYQEGVNFPVDVVGLTVATHVAAGSGHSCAVRTDGSTVCWGANGSAQLGTGSAGPRQAAPVVAAVVPQSSSVEAGDGHTCATDAEGLVRCWGARGLGLLGDGVAGAGSVTPVDVAGLS